MIGGMLRAAGIIVDGEVIASGDFFERLWGYHANQGGSHSPDVYLTWNAVSVSLQIVNLIWYHEHNGRKTITDCLSDLPFCKCIQTKTYIFWEVWSQLPMWHLRGSHQFGSTSKRCSFEWILSEASWLSHLFNSIFFHRFWAIVAHFICKSPL